MHLFIIELGGLPVKWLTHISEVTHLPIERLIENAINHQIIATEDNIHKRFLEMPEADIFY